MITICNAKVTDTRREIFLEDTSVKNDLDHQKYF